MSRPLVSIIIPVFNGEKTIGNIIDDSLRQTESRIEVIVVDDGSTDATLGLLESYKELDDKVVVMSQSRRGPSAARNKAIEVARGDYIMFFDADDRVSRTIVEKMVMKIDSEKNIDMVEAGAIKECIDRDGNIKTRQILMPEYVSEGHKKRILKSLLKSGLFHSLWNKIYKLNIIKENHIIFNESVQNGEDLIFNLMYTSHIKGYSSIHEGLYFYQKVENSDSITSRRRGASKVFEYRSIMFTTLTKYIGSEYPILLQMVRARWFVSSILSVIRSRALL